MTTGPRSQCDACRHLRSGAFNAPLTCDAFPDGIPTRIFRNGMDHRQPIDGDHGIRFEAVEGDEFPEYALLPRFRGVGGNPN